VPARCPGEPLLLEVEQVSEHGTLPRVMPPPLPLAPRVLRGCGLPDCDADAGLTSADEMRLRCLLFTIHPLAAFLPIRWQTYVPSGTETPSVAQVVAVWNNQVVTGVDPAHHGAPLY